jgi:two-component system sensor histidine kinase YesM
MGVSYGKVRQKGSMRNNRRKRSFKYQLIVSFCMISIIPIVAINLFSYYNITTIVQNNVDELNVTNLSQTKNYYDVVLSSYEDLLYQMYTDDYIVELVDKIVKREDVAVSRSQLRRTLRGIANVKPYIQCITVITDRGDIVFYDKLATSTTNIKWMENYKVTSKELYDSVSAMNHTEFLSTKYAAEFNSQSYYLFHMAHRIVDYKKINKKNGIIILSIDEQLLKEICSRNRGLNNGVEHNNITLITDSNGYLVSFEDNLRVGTKIIDTTSEDQQDLEYKKFVKTNGFLTGRFMKVYRIYDEDRNWNIINISDQSNIIGQMTNQQKLIIMVIVFSVFLLIIIIIFVSNHLTSSIGQIVKAMKAVERGKLTTQVKAGTRMPVEVEIIADQFNHMITELGESIEKEKAAIKRQREAEITALEAQINPHFIYNTLDTINWLAIDKEQYEISNAINSLAKILRYGVDKSNGAVEIRKEVEWLKQYVFLQQTRFKNSFQFILHAEPHAQDFFIHKLLLQPFVENAVLHGFDGRKENHILEIMISEEQGTIRIMISDNGKGMSEKVVEQINENTGDSEEVNSHIGISNAIGRIKMYYGTAGKVKFISKSGEGTSIFINIPKSNGIGGNYSESGNC